MSLRKEALNAIPWVIFERFGEQTIQFVVLIVLARLLSPAEFGLIAMLTVVIAISRITIDSGMGQAIIRKDHISLEDRSTVFTFNLILSLVTYFLFYLILPWIAEFYNTQELIKFGRVLGLSFIFYSFTIVQRAELTQSHRFKDQAYAKIPAILISGIIAITMAYYNLGAWALIAHSLLFIIFNSIGLWLFNPVKIRLKIYSKSFKELFGFSSNLLLSGLIVVSFKESYKLIIGKLYSANELGLYTQAKKIQEIFSTQIISVVRKLSYPILSKSKKDLEKLKKGYKEVLVTSSRLIFPLMFTTLILSEPIVEITLGEKWIKASIFLKILCVSGLIYHVNDINLNLLKVLGKSSLVLKLALIKYTIITISILVGIKFGIHGLVISQVISSYCNLFVNSFYTNRLINYSIIEQILDLLKSSLYCLPLIVILLLSSIYLEITSFLDLVLMTLAAIITYSSTMILFKDNINKLLLVNIKQKFL